MNEIRALTGLRGFAAMAVFFAHTRDTLQLQGLELPVPQLFLRLFMSGGRQVDIFFVLSGFILAMTYRKWFENSITGEAYFKFLRRRFARIYPLHFFILALVVAFVLAANAVNAPTLHGLARFDFGTLPEHLLLVHAWGFLDGPGEWNPPSWSISIEALAYLVFPALMWANSRWGSKRPWLVMAAAIAAGCALNAVMHWGTYGVEGISRGLCEFFLGCATVNFVGTPVAAWLQSTAGSWCAAAAFCLGFAVTPDTDTNFLIGLVSAPLMLTFCALNPPSRLLGWRPIHFLGEISYSIYLGHFLFSSIAYRLVSVAWMKTGMLATATGIALIVVFVLIMSTITYYAVERPGRDLLRERRKPQPATT